MHERSVAPTEDIFARVERMLAHEVRGQERVPDAEAHRLRSTKRRKRLARRLRRIAAMQAELLTWRMMRKVKKPRPGRSRPSAERRQDQKRPPRGLRPSSSAAGNGAR